MPRRAAERAYGSDAYWASRYTDGGDEDLTHEWLLSWRHLRPVVLPALSGRKCRVADLGCGTSSLGFDLLADTELANARVFAIDNAPGALESLEREKTARAARGEASAARLETRCSDVTQPRALDGYDFDATIDKSTTDGLLCDRKAGAARVRAMYAAVGRAMAADGVCVLVSWRDPEADGLDWLLDPVLGGLREGSADASLRADGGGGCRWCWDVDIHSVRAPTADGACRRATREAAGAHGGDEISEPAPAPHVYLIRRRPRRLLKRRAAGRDEADEGGTLTLRQHEHGGDG